MTIEATRTIQRTFLVECYMPGLDRALVDAASDRARAACSAMRTEGRAVDYLGALLLPGDEIVFHLFGAGDVTLTRETATLAGLDAERVVESIVVGHVDAWAPTGARLTPR
jgi:hypothetical protein